MTVMTVTVMTRYYGDDYTHVDNQMNIDNYDIYNNITTFTPHK